MIVTEEHIDLPTPNGPMRTHITRPVSPGRYPGIAFWTEIFQVTGPIRRSAAMLAGHGYLVAIPEVYHEFEAPGTVLPYDQTGSDRGNELKYTKELGSYDADIRAVLDHLAARPDCTGKLGAMGICLGGHLAFRSALDPRCRAAACFYATDLAQASLGRGRHDDSLARAAEIRGELLMIWGHQDPHIPLEARRTILTRLDHLSTAHNLRYTWHEVNGAHAFMRDEGPRYDPELALQLYGLVLAFFHRRLGAGDLP